MARNRVIGAQGKIPWHLPVDLKFFKTHTMGHVLIMGRRTYESIGKPLPGRETIVVSRTMPPTCGVTVVRSLAEIDSSAFQRQGRTLFIAGGGEIYSQTISQWREVLVTILKREVPNGDVFFPIFEEQFSEPELIAEHPECHMWRYCRA